MRPPENDGAGLILHTQECAEQEYRQDQSGESGEPEIPPHGDPVSRTELARCPDAEATREVLETNNEDDVLPGAKLPRPICKYC